MKRAAEDKELNPRLVLVDGAQGAASCPATLSAGIKNSARTTVLDRVEQLGFHCPR
jgi:hypothetical protein